MLSESQGMFMSAPWYARGTGLTLVWMVFGVGLIGEGLQRRGGGEAVSYTHLTSPGSGRRRKPR